MDLSAPGPLGPVHAFDALALVTVLQLIGHRRALRSARQGNLLALGLLLVAVAAVSAGQWQQVARTAYLPLLIATAFWRPSLRRAYAVGALYGATAHAAIAVAILVASGGPRSSAASYQKLASLYQDLGVLIAGTVQEPRIADGLLRAQGLTGHPNELAGVLVLALVALLISRRIERPPLQWCGLILSCALILTLSRGSTAVAVGVVGISAARSGLQRRLRRLVAIICVSLLAAMMVSPDIAQRFLSRGDPRNYADRAEDVSRLRTLPFLPSPEFETAHNSLVYMMQLSGIFLGLVWVALLALVFKWGWRSHDKRSSTLATTSIVALMLMEDRIQSPSFLAATIGILAMASLPVVSVDLTEADDSPPSVRPSGADAHAYSDR